MSQTTHHAIKFQRVTYRRDSSGKYHQSVAEYVIICPIDQGLGDVIYGLSYQPILDLYCVKDHPDNLVEFLFVVSDHPFSYA